MNRTRILLAGLLVALAAGLSACNKDGTVDTSKVESTFSSADGSLKAEADKIVAAVKSADYAGAGASLQKLASNVKLTPEQQASLKDLMAQVQEKAKEAVAKAGEAAGEAAKKAGDAANNALKDVGGALKK